MKPIKAAVVRFTLWASLGVFSCARGADADLLNGKWSVKKVNEEGQSRTQTLEITKGKFVFEMLGATGDLVAHAEGDISFEKLGPFNVARFSHMRAGESATNLDQVDDEYMSVYQIDGDSWTLATNLDRQREQKATLDVYQRVKTNPEPKTLVIDRIEMADTPQSGTWYLCFEATVGSTTHRFYVENKGYEKNHVTIPIGLELGKMKPGEKCRFKMQLDDVDGDVCTDEVDNRSTGEFVVSGQGTQSFSPEDHWRYTLAWHLR